MSEVGPGKFSLRDPCSESEATKISKGPLSKHQSQLSVTQKQEVETTLILVYPFKVFFRVSGPVWGTVNLVL